MGGLLSQEAGDLSGHRKLIDGGLLTVRGSVWDALVHATFLQLPPAIPGANSVNLRSWRRIR